MSEQKLNLSQKAFAYLERMVKETQIHSANLTVTTPTSGLTLTIDTSSNDVKFNIDTQVADTAFSINTDSHEILEDFLHPHIYDSAVDSLKTIVIDEKIELILTAAVHDEHLHFTSQPIDFFKKFNLQSKLFYETTIKTIDFKNLKPRVHDSVFAINTAIRDNLFIFKRLTVEQKPVVLSFLSENHQLGFWRQAVLQTRKEPRHLDLIGIYIGVPYDIIEKIRLNYAGKRLCYNFKLHSPGKATQLNDIALFGDLDTGKTVVILMK